MDSTLLGSVCYFTCNFFIFFQFFFLLFWCLHVYIITSLIYLRINFLVNFDNKIYSWKVDKNHIPKKCEIKNNFFEKEVIKTGDWIIFYDTAGLIIVSWVLIKRYILVSILIVIYPLTNIKLRKNHSRYLYYSSKLSILGEI